MPKFTVKKINLSDKDISLILFFVALIVIIWSLISFSSYIADFSKRTNVNINKITNLEKDNWLNLSNPLTKSDLKNRLIIVKFWNYSCASCIQNINKLKDLRLKHGDNILILAIHSAKFSHENSLSAIKKAIIRYNIDFPVLADTNLKLYHNFAIKSLPTYLIIDPLGKINARYEKASDIDELIEKVNDLAIKYRFRVKNNEIPLSLQKNNIIKTILQSPSRLAYAKKFNFNNKARLVLFISDVGNNNISVVSIAGELLYKIGGQRAGYRDGSFNEALFNNPNGLVFYSNKLYVADSGNNAIRVIDFAKKNVKTLIGSGNIGGIINKEIISVDNVKLNNPLDIEFYPDKNNLLIANSGTNQILTYSFKDKTVRNFAGSGEFGLKDGSAFDASLAQTSDLYTYKNEIYFIDSKTSSLRKANKDGVVTTILGKGVDEFGYKNGIAVNALMQNPTSLTVDDTGIYIVDSFNKMIRRFDFNDSRLSDYHPFNSNSQNLEFDEPASIISIADRFYVSDSNNNRIISINRANHDIKLFNIIPLQKIKKDSLAKIVLDDDIIKNIKLESDKEIDLSINLNSNWKINDLAPSYINLLSMDDVKDATIIDSYNWNDIKNNKIKLPPLKSDKKYLLQGLIYFCEDKKNALCYIKDIQYNLIIESKNYKNIINIDLTQIN